MPKLLIRSKKGVRTICFLLIKKRFRQDRGARSGFFSKKTQVGPVSSALRPSRGVRPGAGGWLALAGGFFAQRGPWPDASSASGGVGGGKGGDRGMGTGVCSPKEEEKEFEQEETEVTELARQTGAARRRGSADSFRQVAENEWM